MKKLFLYSVFILIYFSGALTYAQNQVINIWPNKIPGAIENNTYKEEDMKNDKGIYRISKVVDPTLTVFLPEKEKANGTAVIICPGGGYEHLAYEHEGVATAKWLNDIGITAFILKYRLPSDLIMKDKTVGPLQDAQEAIRIVRQQAKQWNIAPDKIGIAGFSAGGHLAATLCTHYKDKVYDSDTTSARPDFSILLYPVISMKSEITHKGSRRNLLGNNPSEKEIENFSNELQVNRNTPPAFIALAENDKSVPIQNSIDYFLALKKHNIPAELHIFQTGGHGFGLGKKGETESYWPDVCANWLKALGYL